MAENDWEAPKRRNTTVKRIKFDAGTTFSREKGLHRISSIRCFKYGQDAAKTLAKKGRVFTTKMLQTCYKVNDSINVDSAETEPQPSTSKQILDQKTPHSDKTTCSEIRKRARSSETGDIWNPPRSRETPLPSLTWANSSEVWQTMVYKEEATSRTRNCRLFEDPTSFLPRMRSILVDWIMEVCEVYHLRRITFYLALDYIDRYLTLKPTVPKHQLQLIGISALFIAAKLEEIYPPKLSEFSYVCDGACGDEDILDCEIVLLNSLGWDVNPMTPTGWLNLYMQIYFDSIKDQEDKTQANEKRDFFFPQYSAYQFTRVSNIIDLFALDPGYLLFSYSTIAAAAMFFYFGKGPALQVSGLIWDDLKDCIEYMAVYYTTLCDATDPRLQSVMVQEIDERQEATYKSLKIWVPELTVGESHSLQTHIIDLQYFEKATVLRLQKMGLSVRKTYITKTKLQKDKILNNGTNCVAGECIECETTIPKENCDSCNKSRVIMFEIESLVSPPSPTHDVNSPSHSNGNDIDFFASKKNFTFDEILLGIHNCTTSALVPHRQDGEIFETN